MKTKQILLWAIMLIAVALNSNAFREPDQPTLPNFDHRPQNHRLAPDRAQAAAQLKKQTRGINVDFHPITGSVKLVHSTESFLTGPDKNKDRLGPTKTFLDNHRALFGHGSEVLANANIKRDFITPHNQMHTIVWEQHVDGIAVFEGLLISHTTKNGELVNVSSHFLADATKAANANAKNRAALQANPLISAEAAVVASAANVGEQPAIQDVAATTAAAGSNKQQKLKSPALLGEADIHLVWLPVSGSAMILCWEVTFTSRKRSEMFTCVVDAQTGEVIVRHCLTQYISPATYRVFTSDSPSPFSPGFSTPVTNQPPLTSRSLVTLSAILTNGSPNGWIDDSQNTTLGNNVDAHTDTNADNIADTGSRPIGSPARTFDFPLDLNLAPSTYQPAAVVQLFYWNNFMHDKLYDLGFTEAAGNFQTTNFNRGGLGNDAVQADAQDGSGVNNANMSTSSDGSPPRMQMYVFTGPTPDRDGDLDADVILHEYTHGLSNRRVGGGVGISASQSAGMGEGWSDFYAISLLSESTDDVNGNYPAGGYSSFLMTTGYSNNYYFGIRRYPYTTDMNKNPLTFKDIDSAQASAHTGIPKSPLGGSSASEVHNQGELWCVTLWEVRARLINKYGWSIGNRMALQIVTDGMNLSPANPNFLQARDGIIQADLVDNGGANRTELWAAFAKRGMGYFATSPSSSTTTGVVESYAVPDDMNVSPLAGQTFTGPNGGPFSPAPNNLVVMNNGTNQLSWTATNSSTWLAISTKSGVLSPGTSNTIAVSLTSATATLPTGIYTDTIRFTNVTTGVGQTRQYTLRVGQIDYFTEQFTASDNDLDNTTITFTPDGSTNYYRACRDIATNFPTSIAGATNTLLQNHTTKTMVLTNGATISIYGKATNTLYISSDGHITINTPDSSGSATLANHFTLPRVAGLFAHLHPADSGGAVYWQQLSNRVAVTFVNVSEYATANYNNFQMELFFDGTIRMTWLAIPTTGGLCGLSKGNGYPSDFAESDLSSYASCSPPIALSLPSPVTEGDGTILGAVVSLPSAPATDLAVTLSSSDTNEVITPTSVIVPAGQTNAPFSVTVLDDNIPDGTQFVNITASASGYQAGSATMAVNDIESATLDLVAPSIVREGNGPTNLCTVSIGFPAPKTIAVNLASSESAEIIVPASVFIPVGQTSATFALTVVDDNRIDGPQNITITAIVTNWAQAFASVTVLDNEPTNLAVALPASAVESAGVLSNAGTVSIAGTLGTDLTVSLVSSDPSQLIVPPSATIQAGKTFAKFDITTVDNTIIEGSRILSVSASATGFIDGAGAITIYDNESPAIPTNPSPADHSSNIIASADLAWSSGETVPTNNNYAVYLGTSPGSLQLLGTTTGSNWALPNLTPLTTYYWQIIASRTGQTAGPVWQFTTRGVDHFAWSPISSPQYVSNAFPVTVTAKDEFNATVSNFTGAVNFAAYIGSASSLPYFSEDFEDGDFAGWTNSMTTAVTGTVTNETAANGNRSFTIIGGNLHYSGISHSLSNSKPAQVDYFVRYTPTSSSAALGYFVLTGNSTANSDTAVFALILTNTLLFVNDTSPSVAIPVNPLSWIGVSLRFNWTNKTYQLLVNNTLISANVPFRGSSVSNLTTVYLYNYGGGQAWWDDIKFYNGTPASPLPMTPTNSDAFIDGQWSGSLTVQAPSSNVTITATDSNNHVTASPAFNVFRADDLSLTMSPLPNSIATYSNVTLTITAQNSGPNDSTQVIVSNALPAGATVTGVAASQGGFSSAGNSLIFDLGTLASAATATMTITLNMSNAVTAVDTATISRNEPESYLSNNVASASTTVFQPSISIANGSLTESDQGFTTSMAFAVTLLNPPAVPVIATFATSNGTAIAGADYSNTVASITFAPGETSKTIFVPVYGDNLYESNETFTVTLISITNASVTRGIATGTIYNNDAVPTISIAPAAVVEGTGGTINLTFAVTLSTASGVPATFSYFTADGTAKAPGDYTSAVGTNTFAPGEVQKTISVSVQSDELVEGNETFVVYLTNAINATFASSAAIGTIVDDDFGPNMVAGTPLLVSESFVPPDGALDSGETVTVSLPMMNTGNLSTTNLVATLLATGGVVQPSGPQNYGGIAPGNAATNQFSFVVNTANGGTLTATLALSDNGVNRGTVSYSFSVGPTGNFQIASLTTNHSFVVDHNNYTGDDRGGIAASPTRFFYTGDTSTARFDLLTLSNITSLGTVYDALVSDLKTEKVYLLANGSTPLVYSGGTCTSLIELDGSTGAITTNRITLSSAISMASGSGIFAGYGRIVLLTANGAYNVELPTGVVTYYGAMTIPTHAYTENWAFWGVAENFNNTTYLVYVRDYTTIVRTRVTDGLTTVLQSFSNLSDMACITVSIRNNRWYFHHEYNSQFGGLNETAGYADATFNLTASAGTLNHFAWSPISSPQAAGEPFAATVIARDAFYQPISNYNGTIDVLSLAGNPMAPTSISLTNGSWTGLLSVQTTTTNTTVLRARDNLGHSGDSTLFQVISSTPRAITASQTTNGLMLSWPAPWSTYVLEWTSNLEAPDWQPVTNASWTTNGVIFVNDGLQQNSRFYRLRR